MNAFRFCFSYDTSTVTLLNVAIVFLFAVIDIDDCEYENCSGNGDCLDRKNGFICECKNNYFGKNCEKSKFR